MPGGTTDVYYLSGVGIGGTGTPNAALGSLRGGNGGNGEIVLTYGTAAVPEPSSLALIAAFGLTSIGYLARKRQRARKPA